MPKLKCNTVMIALAAALLSASAALADVKPDDRSYLPPQTKEAGKQAPAQTNDRPRYARHGTQHRARTSYAHQGERRRYAHHRTQRQYAHRNARRYYASRGMFPGIFFGLFR
jgi:hypothetical protein